MQQDLTLPRLHAVLQVVMGWTNSHLHQFKVGDVYFAEPHQEELRIPVRTAAVLGRARSLASETAWHWAHHEALPTKE